MNINPDAIEIIDIIDKNNNIKCKMSKLDAHTKGLLHKTVIAEVRDESGRFLLVKQASHKQDPGQFVSPVGGHVLAGETEEEALRREALEEIGLRNFECKYVGRAIFKRAIRSYIENHYFIVFEIKLSSKRAIKLGDESVEFRYFTEKKIKQILESNPKYFGDAYLFVVENFYRHFLN